MTRQINPIGVIIVFLGVVVAITVSPWFFFLAAFPIIVSTIDEWVN